MFRYRTLVLSMVLCVLFLQTFGCRAVSPPGGRPARGLVSIREDNVTLVDGESFFPIGMFHVYLWKPLYSIPAYNSFENIFADLKSGGFNTVHTYQANHYDHRMADFLLTADEFGFKVVLPASTDIDNERKLREDVAHDRLAPSLLSWYLVDEPDGVGVTPAVVRRYHETVKSVDPWHLTSIVLVIPGRYIDYLMSSDVLMVDPYPIYKKYNYRVSMVADYMDAMRDAMRTKGVNKPIWAILQAFGYQDKDNRAWGADREPTYEEERCMTYLAIVHGAKGIFYYAFGAPGEPGRGGGDYFLPNSLKLWAGVKKIGRELNTLIPVLTSLDSRSPYSVKVAGEKKDEKGNVPIHALLKDGLDGRRYLIAANVLKEPVDATFDLPEAASAIRVSFEGREINGNGHSFKDGFGNYEVHVYSWQIHDSSP